MRGMFLRVTYKHIKKKWEFWRQQALKKKIETTWTFFRLKRNSIVAYQHIKFIEISLSEPISLDYLYFLFYAATLQLLLRFDRSYKALFSTKSHTVKKNYLQKYGFKLYIIQFFLFRINLKICKVIKSN